MKRARETFYPATRAASSSGVFEVLTAFGERASDEPEALEQGLREMARGLRESLSLRALAIEVGARSSNLSTFEGMSGGFAAEFPILQGKMLIGKISASPDKPGSLSEAQISGLRSAAAMVSLAVCAADASEVAAERAAHGSVVQLASEALGSILDEGRLYRTVLVLAMGLLSSCAGAVLSRTTAW